MTTRSAALLLPSLCLAIACSKSWKDNGEDPVGADDSGDTQPDTDTDTGGQDTDTGTPPATDADGDGHVTDAEGGDDCDDSDDTVYPGAPELCDGKDNDCDGRSDADADIDNDGISDCSDYCPVYASPGAAGDGRYDNPVGTLQEAVDLAGSTGCNEARAFYGTYVENVNFDGWPVNLESLSGAGATIIDGAALDSVVTFESGEADDSRLYDFTITNGGGSDGPGISIHDSSPTIEGNVITGNTATVANYLGGGIRIYDGSPTIVDNTISENDAGYGMDEEGADGGGLDIRGGSPYIEGNFIVDNTAGDGGGLWLAYSDAIITQNWISGNVAVDNDLEAGGQGGGINVQIGGTFETWVIANVISDNSAGMFGGGIVTYEDNAAYGEARVENNTIVYNEVVDTDYGAGICQYRRTSPTFVNNVIAFNHGVGAYSEDGIDSTFTYNLVYGNEVDYDGLTGASNTTGDPRFTNATDDGDWTNDDFHPKSTSPTRDVGDPSILDVDGSRSDIGAYGGVNGGW